MRCPMCRVSSQGQDVYQTEHQRKPLSPFAQSSGSRKVGGGGGAAALSGSGMCRAACSRRQAPWGNTGTGFPGNGSDEVLAFCFQAFFDPERPILFADITYTFYAVYTDYFGLKAWQIPLDEDFSLPVERFCKAENCGGVVIANPNAPTGRSVDLEDIRRVLEEHRDVVVLVDEAYVDFGGVSADTLLKEYDNLVVVRTLSKSRALAGLRVGYALGSPNLIAGLCCVRDSINSYTVDRLAQAGAVAALEDGPYFEEMRERVIRTRERTEERLRAMGFAVLESKANFLFVSHPKRTGKALLDGLREQGILVRWFDRPRIGNYLRISVGTDDEMDALCAALKALTEG